MPRTCLRPSRSTPTARYAGRFATDPVTDLDHQSIDVDDRVYCVQWPVPPLLKLVPHSVGYDRRRYPVGVRRGDIRELHALDLVGGRVVASVGEVLEVGEGLRAAGQLGDGTMTDRDTPTEVVGLAAKLLVGDADCLGSVNSIDAAFILQFDAGLLGALPCPINADVDGDGMVTSIDAAHILQFDAGLIDSL